MNKSFASNKEALFSKTGTKEGVKAAQTLNAKPTSTFTTHSSTGSTTTTMTAEKKRVSLEKLKEAEDWRLKGTKALKTSIFGNWKPDYLMAAPYFERAANVYKGTGADDQAKVMWLKAAECQEHVAAYATAALDMSKAAAIAKVDDEEEAGRYMAKEAEYWLLSGDVGRSSDAYMRAAACVEDASPSTAVEYTMQAVDQLCPEEGDPVELSKAPMASDVLTKALNLCIRAERFAEGLQVATKAGKVLASQQLHTSLYKMYCVQTILALYQGDLVLADKTFMEVHLQNSGYIRSNESEVAENLIRAGKAMSAEALQEALKDLNKAYLDNNIVRIAKRLTIEKIAGMGDDSEMDGLDVPTKSALPPSIRGGSRPVEAAGADDAAFEVDPDMELSEEEKAKLRNYPMAHKNSLPRPAPKPVAPAVPEPLETPDSGSGMIDFSDLQAELDNNVGGDDDDDLDAAIREARELASLEAPGEEPEVASAPAPVDEHLMEEDIDHHGPPKPPRRGSGTVTPPPPPPVVEPPQEDEEDDLLR